MKGEVWGGYQDPASLVLDEKLDEKDGLLMDGEDEAFLFETFVPQYYSHISVPVLPQPNERRCHTDEATLPTRLNDLLAPSKHKDRRLSEQTQVPHKGFLRKVKGVQLLRIELSWM